MQKSSVVDTLIENLAGLPGIGKKTAQRLTFYIMKMELDKALSLSEAIKEVREKIKYCSRCFNLTEIDPCEWPGV